MTLNMLLDAKNQILIENIDSPIYFKWNGEDPIGPNPETEVTRISNFSSFTYSNKAVMKV